LFFIIFQDTKRNDQEYLKIIEKIYDRSVLESVITDKKEIEEYNIEKEKRDAEWLQTEKEKQKIEAEKQNYDSEQFILSHCSSSSLLLDSEKGGERRGCSPLWSTSSSPYHHRTTSTSPYVYSPVRGAGSSLLDTTDFDGIKDSSSPIGRLKSGFEEKRKKKKTVEENRK
jgi:hypothetical protein